MADNVTFQTSATATPPDATVVATDDVGGIQFQKMKLDVGGDGVSAPLSNANPVPVSDAGGSLTVDGPLTDTELRASAVPVSLAAAPLPSGAATEVTLALIKAKTDNIDVALSTRTKPADTQLVSAASLPLPSGAATLAEQQTQTTGIGGLTETAPATDTASSGLNGRLQRIAQRLTSLIALLPSALGAGGGLKVDGSGTALPVSGSLTVTGVATETTLATRLSESDFDTKTGALTETAPATDTASSGLNGRLQRIAQRVSSLITALGSPFQAGGSIGNTTFASTVADAANVVEGAVADAAVTAGATGTLSAKLRSISRDLVANIVLAAGANIIGKVGIDQTTPGTTNAVQANAGTNLNTSSLALESTQSSGNTLTGAVTETAPASDTASSGLNGRLQRIAQRLTTLLAVFPATIDTNSGNKSASTLRVVLATDQPALTNALTVTDTSKKVSLTVLALQVTASGDTTLVASGTRKIHRVEMSNSHASTALTAGLKIASQNSGAVFGKAYLPAAGGAAVRQWENGYINVASEAITANLSTAGQVEYTIYYE